MSVEPGKDLPMEFLLLFRWRDKQRFHAHRERERERERESSKLTSNSISVFCRFGITNSSISYNPIYVYSASRA